MRLNILLVFTLALTSCAEKRIPFHLPFVAVWEGKPVTCASKRVALTDLRFYVSELQLIDHAGNVHAVPLLRDDRWQSRDIAMIDLENGTHSCINGTEEVNDQVRGTVPAGIYAALRFTIGVPFESNHANPLTAEAPLNDGAMHWHWRAGYKFLRAGSESGDGSFWLHLGSTGCEGTVRDISGCTSPNRVVVELQLESLESSTIEIELAELLDPGAGSDCSSGPAESACAAPFAALGLAFAGASDPSVQQVFRLAQ